MSHGAVGGYDLFEAADALARLVGGPVGVLDLDFRVLAYSAVPGQRDDESRRAAILHRRTPERWLRWMNESGFRNRLRDEIGPVHMDLLPWATEMSRFIQAVRPGGHVVGYVLVMCTEPELPEQTAQVVREFADMLGPDLAEVNRRSADSRGRSLSQFFAGALPAGDLAQLLKRDESSTAVVVLAVEAPAGKRSAITKAVTTRADATRALTLYAQLQFPTALVTSEQETLYVLIAAPGIGDRMLDVALSGIVAQLRTAIGADVLAAAGGVHTGFALANESRHEADQTLHALRECPGSACGRYDTMRLEIVVQNALHAVRSRGPVIAQILEQLGTADAARHDEQLRTIASYLDAFGDVRAAAARLRIHPNTLRYRLRRIEESAGLQLSDPRTRLALELVLRAGDNWPV